MQNMGNLTHRTGFDTGFGNATLLANPGLCTLQTCDLSLAAFLYLPSLAANGTFTGIFTIYIFCQLFLGVKYKTWGYTAATMLGLLGEIIGYVARILINQFPFDNTYFLIYLICLTIAPAFLTAAVYLCLSRIVIVYGEHLSRFKPRTYTLVFCTCDIISLVLQAAGGGIAATATTQSDSNTGKNILLAGLGFQVFSLILFGLAASEFVLRVRKSKDDRNPRYTDLTSSRLFKCFLLGLFVASVTIFARCVYRCVELSGGFHGTLFVSDQAVFIVLEGVMISLATTCLTLLHPGICFQGTWHEAVFHFRTRNAEQGFEMKRNRISGETLMKASQESV